MRFETQNELILKILGERSQFTYHHDLQRTNGLIGCSRADVAEILRKKYPNQQEYMEQVKYGTIKYLFENHPEEIMMWLLKENDEEKVMESLQEFRKMYQEANNKIEMFVEEDKKLISR